MVGVWYFGVCVSMFCFISLSPLNPMFNGDKLIRVYLILKALCHSPGMLICVEVSCSLHSNDISSLGAAGPCCRRCHLGGSSACSGSFRKPFSVSEGSASSRHVFEEEEEEFFLLCWLTIRKALCITDWRKLKMSWQGTSCWCWYSPGFALLCRQEYSLPQEGMAFFAMTSLPSKLHHGWVLAAVIPWHHFFYTNFGVQRLTVTNSVEVSLSAIRHKTPHCCSCMEIILPAEQHFQE